MRRKDKEITDTNDKLAIIDKCKICRLGLSENNFPYVVPLNYGYTFENEKLTLYFHGAKEGKKVEIIKGNSNACFENDCDAKLIESEKACNYGYEFKSIVGFGKITFLETSAEKTFGLNRIMIHQTGKKAEFNFTEEELNNVCVYKMSVVDFSGKQKIQMKRLAES